MSKRRVYVDACILITAFKGDTAELSDAAIALLEDPDIDRLFSRVTELEVLPFPTFHKKHEEQAFYQEFFTAAVRVACTEETLDAALDIATRNGLTLGDALHVACAIKAQADELVTLEKRTRLPSAPAAGIPIRSLRKY